MITLSSLDYNYLTKLANRAKIGDSDAFAELYAATYERQFGIAHRYLEDKELACRAIYETYSFALQHISVLGDPSLFVAWLSQINFRVSYNMLQKKLKENPPENGETRRQVTIDGRTYTINRVLNLPFTESQVIILKYFFGRKNRQIAHLMDISRRDVKQYLKNGKIRLNKILSV